MRNAFSKIGLLLLASLVSWFAAAADSGTANFEQANKLYEQGKFAEAAAVYEKMIDSGQASAAVFYNLGNAFFKDGQLGRAIYNYRRAEWLTPRDPDLQGNLMFSRKVANGSMPEETNFWNRFIGKLALDEWTLITMLLWWAWIALLALVLWRPDWRRSIRPYVPFVGAVALLFTFFTWAAARERIGHAPAVVVAKEAVVRYGPLPESRSFYSLHDGAELTVLDQKGEWLQVADVAQRIGWVRQEQVLMLEAGPRPKNSPKS